VPGRLDNKKDVFFILKQFNNFRSLNILFSVGELAALAKLLLSFTTCLCPRASCYGISQVPCARELTTHSDGDCEHAYGDGASSNSNNRSSSGPLMLGGQGLTATAIFFVIFDEGSRAVASRFVLL
jgi:hypothetical protein